jgi:Flp pilus assembly protein TadD
LVKKTFGLTNFLILVVLLTLILAPRPITGYLDLERARRSDAAGDYAGAAFAYALAAECIPWRGDVWGLAGQAALKAEEPQQSVRWFAAGESRQALLLADWQTYGDAFQLLGDQPSAVWAWEQGLAQYGPSAGIYWRLARAARQRGVLEQSMSLLSEVLALAPEDAAAHDELGLLLTAIAPEKALAELLQASRLDPAYDAQVQELRTAINTALLENDRAYQYLLSGRGLAALNEWELAETAFRNALAARPDYAEAWAWLGEARQQLGQEGRIQVERALVYNPKSAMIQGLYGIYLQRQGQPEKALAAYQKAADLEPQDPGWQMSLASASEQAGDLVAALGYYLHAVELAPQQASTWRATAEFSLRNSVNLIGVGLPAVRGLLTLAPDDWQSYDLAGQIMLETGDPVGAEEMLKKAIQLDITQAAPALHLGMLYLQTNNQARAYSYLNQAIAFNPNGPFGLQAGRLLEQYFP